MKSIKTTIFIVFIFLGYTTFSQETTFRDRFSFGLKVGLNVNSVYNEKEQDFSADPRVGFAGGGFISLPLGKLLALQPEIMFSQKGVKGSGAILGTPYSWKRMVNYVDIPVLLAFRPAEFVSIHVGPQLGFRVSQKDVFTFGNSSVTNEEDFDKNTRTFMLGAQAGLEFYINHFVISPRVGLDFFTTKEENNSTTTVNPEYKNLTFQFTLGYRF